MAVAKKTKSMEEALWESANKLRGSVEPAEYKHIVLSLIFLKFAYDKFVIRREELIANGEQQYIDMEACEVKFVSRGVNYTYLPYKAYE